MCVRVCVILCWKCFQTTTQMRSIVHSMQPFISGCFVHISANSHFRSYFLFVFVVVVAAVHSLSFILLLSRGSHYLGSFTSKRLARYYAMTVEECPHSAKSSNNFNDGGLHWKTERCRSTTSVNRVTYLLFDEFVLHVVCMSIHFVIKGYESACRLPISMSQYRSESIETIAIVNPKCWPHF